MILYTSDTVGAAKILKSRHLIQILIFPEV